ncbi:6-phosphogluconolactonase [Bacteroidia bacterium]|nr:6-phosphogluconolactonase [Bacteroidia bacterium]
MKYRILLFFCVLAFTGCSSTKEKPIPQEDVKQYLLAGAYSDGTTPGMVVYDFDTQTGEFEYVSAIDGIENPSYLAVSPDEQFVYSVNETANGAVSSFTFDKTTGTLRLINYQFTEGADPCYISINQDATLLFTANYNGGNLSVFPLGKEGCIQPLVQNIAFKPASHIHTAVFSPDEKRLLVTDLGTDKIYQYYLMKTADGLPLLREDQVVQLEHGSGPRHLAFHPNGKFLYSINELSGTITVMDYADGIQDFRQTIVADTTPGVGGKGSADIHLTPDGRFLYASNRAQTNTIAIFSVNPDDGTLTKIGYQPTGLHPRNFLLSPNGKFLLCANRYSDNIQIFEIDSVSGLLHDTEKIIQQSQPVCLQWIRERP